MFYLRRMIFFTDFRKLNDFAGINLYKSLLSKDCVKEFYTRFGQPTVETSLASGIKLQFIILYGWA